MNIVETEFDGLVVLEPKVIEDPRGYFTESYRYDVLKSKGIDIHFIQDNQSKSRKGVLRGLHYQNVPYAQTKLMRVLTGEILDVVVDLRRKKPTFGKSFLIKLSGENRKQLLVPKGFAHGFLVLSEAAEILYKCDEFYNPEAEGGIMYNDPALKIDWVMKKEDLILSQRDLNHPTLEKAIFNF
ncbi:MAG: dTDP-4-dehydrorhamnose 3,5-epimerase [Cytophagales bacterium]|jgi:dTDP-4-dehydrorhamnose 3,5-epimerase|nr:dTDP-4-dehydrorhamnose 3,5-epimerase [Cytophagales bacterium]MCA6369586.1 dTDP-4-dehydrorhamnose 3,5-epimerase [Cytophagales bacterium]MCA6370700.1 dTDP-4-dehydrorhamnose 3,5-epimerase [Cytophagales bacterium]MCA6377118.1 dTDP-4-dehydrorhamnose 3,5-epimerase [Cytophagales bacterium]MCA6383771.1 dTDP-4-dehydrorhamnose 3,5-epimerase [Cytophagales bacterium]